jgi:hypothetical protein
VLLRLSVVGVRWVGDKEVGDSALQGSLAMVLVVHASSAATKRRREKVMSKKEDMSGIYAMRC